MTNCSPTPCSNYQPTEVDTEARKNNAIIYRAAESRSANLKETAQADKDLVIRFFWFTAK